MAPEIAEEFDTEYFEKRLETLKDSQESIQHMSAWCLQRRSHHKKIVACWLATFKKVRVEQRLTLFHLANDVIQYSKRKRYEFVESWATAIQRATTMVRDEKVKGKILRIFKIWEQREIYNEDYLSDLNGLLNIRTAKRSEPSSETYTDTLEEFQVTTIVTNIRECVQLSENTDRSFKKLPKPPICDTENFKQQLKDKSHSSEKATEIERYITFVESFLKTLETEIKSRKLVVSDTEKAIAFFGKQNQEVKVISNAYKKFGHRVELVKKRLDEMMPTLASPIPSPDINAPSPEPDADIQLPDDQSAISINIFKNSINGYSSYLDGNLPFDINDFKNDESKTPSQPIEVIGSRSDDESFNSSSDYFKNDTRSVYSNDTSITIPGLNPLPVPPVQSGYTSLARSAQQYSNVLPPQSSAPFGSISNSYTDALNSTYSTYSADNSYLPNGNQRPYMQPPPMPPSSITADPFNNTWDAWAPQNAGDTPVSTPGFKRETHNTSSALEYSEHDSGLMSTQDVDHRQLHLPAFNIGVKLGLSKDKTRQLDIDHRNLISLTGSPGLNDIEKKSWLSTKDEFQTNPSGDIDYRTAVGPTSKANSMEPPSPTATSSTPIMSISNLAKNTTSPLKSNASSSSDSIKEDGLGGGGRYDPTDMVVDMDMSDEDIDEILKEAKEQQGDPYDSSHTSAAGEDLSINECGDENHMRPPLLETPNEYMPRNMWDPAAVQQQQQQQSLYGNQPQHQEQQPWNQVEMSPWNGGENMARVPPPPRPPFPLQFQYSNANNYEYGNEPNSPIGMGGGPPMRGRGGWPPTPQNHFRNFSRPRGNPFYNRGGGTPRGRSPYRGKFRGGSPWI